MFDQPKFRPNFFERLGIHWCRGMHDSPMWPVRGHYQCRTCHRSFQVPWAGEPAARAIPICIRPEQRVVRRAA